MTAVLATLAACNGRHTRIYDPHFVSFKASYNARFDNILYPSMLMALANYSGVEKDTLFTVSAVAPANNAVLRVVVDSTALNYVTILQEVMPRKGERYTFAPSIKWKFEKLYALRQQGALDLTFTCFVNDEEVDSKTLRLNYRSVNDCLLSAVDTGGTVDYRWLFMGYVNEEHPFIDSILTTILDQGTLSTFAGYQRGRQHVIDEVYSIWYYALDRGITYSSISCTANPSKRASTQHIRFFDEVYNSRQANCIDACVFFASIMRKIGLKPVILVEPCHAYLGYYTDKDRKEMRLLETTITSWVNIPAMRKSYETTGKLTKDQHDRLVKYLTAEQVRRWDAGELTFEQMQELLTQALFKQATSYRQESYKANKKYFTNNENGYQMLPVDELRKVVQPIGVY